MLGGLKDQTYFGDFYSAKDLSYHLVRGAWPAINRHCDRGRSSSQETGASNRSQCCRPSSDTETTLSPEPPAGVGKDDCREYLLEVDQVLEMLYSQDRCRRILQC